MKIYFGENLKRLRTEKGLTQEALAGSLGVSFQTVSKWERGESYPDITLLPVLAGVFEVTADDLLGAKQPQKERQAEDYLALYDAMALKDAPKVLQAFRTAVSRFSDNYAVLVRYMELLRLEKSDSPAEYEAVAHEINAAYFKIMGRCNDEAVRARAKRIMAEHLLFQYDCLGFEEEYRRQAALLIGSLPALSDTKEVASVRLADAENWEDMHGNTVEALSYQLQNALVGFCYYNDRFSAEEKIRVAEHMNGLLELTDTEEHLTKNRLHLIYNYGRLGCLYAEIGNAEKALNCLHHAATLAVQTDNEPEAEYVRRFYETEHRYREMTCCERLRALMTEHYSLPETLKKTPAFREIITSLQ